MRKYQERCSEVLEQVVCNKCGKTLKINENRIEEGVVQIQIPWGYFSGKDGEVHTLDLCEACYDSWIKGFALPVEIEDKNEML